MYGERRVISSMAMLTVWVVEWLRRKEEVDLKLWLMELGYPRGGNEE